MTLRCARRKLPTGRIVRKTTRELVEGIVGVALLGAIYWALFHAEPRDTTSQDEPEIVRPIEQGIDPSATLRITSEGLAARGPPHNPSSAFFGDHELVLRTVRRSSLGMTWLPREEMAVGCVPCFNALTLVAIVDGTPYALNGSTRTWSTRMALRMPGATYSPVRDPYEGPEQEAAELRPHILRLIGVAQDTPGCAIDRTEKGSLQRSFDAISLGTCLPHRPPE